MSLAWRCARRKHSTTSYIVLVLFTIKCAAVQPVPKPVRSARKPMPSTRRAEAEAECRICLEEGGGESSTFHLGLDTFRVPMALHAANRAKVVEHMGPSARGVALLQGGDQLTRYDTDHEPVFRQESYFQYCFGVAEGGCFGAISLPDGKATLFVPKLGVDYEVFCGRYPLPEDFRSKYAVDDVRFVDELPAWLEQELGTIDATASSDAREDTSPSKLFLLHGLNTDSGNYALPATFPGCDSGWAVERKDLAALFAALAGARVTKSHGEVELMRYVNYVSSMAHVEVMRAAKPGSK